MQVRTKMTTTKRNDKQLSKKNTHKPSRLKPPKYSEKTNICVPPIANTSKVTNTLSYPQRSRHFWHLVIVFSAISISNLA